MGNGKSKMEKSLKKVIVFVLMLISFGMSANAEVDKYSKEYLQENSHFSITKPFAEYAVKKAVKSALKKETKANFDINFEGYTTSSIKKGIFKYIELEGKEVNYHDIVIPYVHLKSLTDYNYIDYTQSPMVFKSDMTYEYELLLSEDSINSALKDSDYNKILAKVNRIANPLFVVSGTSIKIIDNKMYIITSYNIPLVKGKERTFIAQSDFEIVNGKIKAKNVSIDTSYGKLGLNKVANLINYLNPLEFTLDLLDDNKHNGTIESIQIVDNKVKVGGKIYVKKANK